MLSMARRGGRGQSGTWIQLLILRILYETPLHGYALNEKINELLAGRRPLKSGSLYTILRRMEKSGLLVSDWDKDSARLERRIYNLTDAGMERLRQGLQMVKSQKRIIDEMMSFYKEKFPEDVVDEKD